MIPHPTPEIITVPPNSQRFLPTEWCSLPAPPPFPTQFTMVLLPLPSPQNSQWLSPSPTQGPAWRLFSSWSPCWRRSARATRARPRPSSSAWRRCPRPVAATPSASGVGSCDSCPAPGAPPSTPRASSAPPGSTRRVWVSMGTRHTPCYTPSVVLGTLPATLLASSSTATLHPSLI